MLIVTGLVCWNVTVVSPSHSKKALSSISVTEFGITMFVKLEQLSNALDRIVVTELGIVTAERLVQYMNVPSSIVVIELGIVTLVSPEQQSNA